MNPIRLHSLLKDRGIDATVMGETDGYFVLHFVLNIENYAPRADVLDALDQIGGRQIKFLDGGLISVNFVRSKR